MADSPFAPHPAPDPSAELRALIAAIDATQPFPPADTPGSLRFHIAFYAREAARRRHWFRLLGSVVIVVTVCLPLLTMLLPELLAAHPRAARLVLSALGTSAALATSLIGFWALQQGWSGHIAAKLALEFTLGRWEPAKQLALREPDQAAARDSILAAARRVEADLERIVTAETSGYFGAIDMKGGAPH